MPGELMKRYFLGHPVAVAATVLFCFAVAILALKWYRVFGQWQSIDSLTDAKLIPRSDDTSPLGKFHNEHDAGHVARGWLQSLAGMPAAIQQSWLVIRLSEVLARQSQRGTTKHLADDLRELSARDSDDSHDSLALVRIIVWAIPMLGFLGTVIGITQTLGGLDFSDGNAAVANLKSGLYVAFDTTALGLVLSVLAIFLQFPVEKSEQRLLAEVDRRVGHLVSNHLPSDEAADNQYELVAQLCEGVRVAVAESLSNQAQLWRETIDDAQQYWQQAHQTQADSIVRAVESTLAPALTQHANMLEQAADRNSQRLHEHWLNWHDGINQWHESVSAWQQSMTSGSLALSKHHESIVQQCDKLTATESQTARLLTLQESLDSNLKRLDETGKQIDENLGAAAGQGMAEGMVVLARAIDLLTEALPKKSKQAIVAATSATQENERSNKKRADQQLDDKKRKAA